MKRRTFLKGSAGSALAMAGLPNILQAAPAYPHSTLKAAFATAHFDPSAPDSFTTIWTADTHYGFGEGAEILPVVWEEVRRMDHAPAFFAVAGDLICKASNHFGQVPGEKQREEAWEEFRAIKTHVDRIEEHIPVKLTLGNHDTHPAEDRPELFHDVFPDRPEYHAFEVKGVPFIFLNGGSCGNPDKEQRNWFRREVEARFDPERSLVTVCHQPSLGRVTNERGVTKAFRHALSDVDGDVWMIGGHHHKNEDQCFQLPQSIITQATITTANPIAWGTEHPGYWIYGFSKGKLAVRVFRRIGQGYAVTNTPPKLQPKPLRLPFEDTDTLWKVLVGEGDDAYRVTTNAQWCQNYWYYTKELVYEFPLSLAENKARRLAVLNSPESDKTPIYQLSPDGTQWTDVELPERKGSMTSLPIPDACIASGAIHVRLRYCAVSGFALLA
ncbi:MAG: metallophosphoesterase [Candidatus Hydrogenedentes bacterium]|nr:metallophosphoesterase [Candidatus Hydrogenedentota bacterium]